MGHDDKRGLKRHDYKTALKGHDDKRGLMPPMKHLNWFILQFTLQGLHNAN
jgi:hypothetical protein